jgi:hypothetical protein
MRNGHIFTSSCHVDFLSMVDVSVDGRTVYEAMRRVTFGRRRTPLSYSRIPGTRATDLN